MIYPLTTGNPDESGRLLTLESVWIQGKLRMWGKWSYIGKGHSGNMFNAILSSKKLTEASLKQVLKHISAAGMDDSEMKHYFLDLLSQKEQTHLTFCTDEEGMMIDAVIAEILVRNENPGLYAVINDRYLHRMSKKNMARQLNEKHPEWSLRTCESRISLYLQVAESMLYVPMCKMFDKNPERFQLQSCARIA